MRWSRTLVFVLFAFAVAACGGGPAPSSADDGGNGGNGGGSSQAAETPAPASQGGGGGGGGGDDMESIFNALIPPNSTEIQRTSMEGGLTGTWSSTDSVESLVSHYGSAIPGTGMEIFSTTNAQGGTSWLFGMEEGSAFGGSVTVAPNTNGEGTSVIVIITGN